MNHHVTKNKIHSLFTILAALCLMTGCAGTSEQVLKYRDQIYFSHSSPSAAHSDRSATAQGGGMPNRTESSTSPSELTLHFDNDSATVREEDVERLQSFLLNFLPNQMPVFLITGHTDNNQSDIYNIRLSDHRAKSTQSAMLGMGVPITQTALRGLGESKPIASNTSYDGRQLNRRVTVQAID